MLIVARRKGQRLVIGHDIEIVVTEISRTTVKLGVIAPAELGVLRGEIRDSIEAANREAAEAGADVELFGEPAATRSLP
ncbi:MAG TPA: carbon storage regulator [Polyangiaceae bacterium]|nr:carbon storage regulator [Polyangiaceae bacterium]